MKYKANKTWEVSIWPNNQPPFLLGYYTAKSGEKAKELASKENGIPIDDNFVAKPVGKKSPLNRWREI